MTASLTCNFEKTRVFLWKKTQRNIINMFNSLDRFGFGWNWWSLEIEEAEPDRNGSENATMT